MAWRPILFATIALPCLIAEVLPIRSYNTADGLAGDSINRIVADSRGFVWFCTPEGLSRFDGYRFVNFGLAEGLPHRSVNALLETRSGEYLVGTARGVCQFQAEGRGKFTTYPPGNTRPENRVTALMQDSAGRIWCGTGGGLFEMLSGHRFRRQPLPAPSSGEERISVNDVVEDAGHKLWVATRSGIYVIGTDGAVQHIAIGGWTENVRTLLLDNRGEIWAGTQDGLALMRDEDKVGRCGVQQVYREAGELKHLDVTSLVAGPGGSIWAGASAGIMRWLPGSRPPVFRMLTRAQGLIDRQVNALATDLAGNVWAATEAAGVMKIQRRVHHVSRTGRPPNGSRLVAYCGSRRNGSGGDSFGKAIWFGKSIRWNQVPRHASQGLQRAPVLGKTHPAAGPDRRLVGGDRRGPVYVRAGRGSGPCPWRSGCRRISEAGEG
ncbi:MAG: two-component regulator propeller domain-containing protein [Bryobacteraceae bacterium]|jgi:ligand-binding sensor domain-containing protein